MKSLDELRKDLNDASQKSPLDINLIVEITNEIARRDPDYVRFSTDAGIISRLGRELVAKEETAVSELIKNSYDADASEVVLTFTNTNYPGGLLTIEDNGLGMTREQLIEGFMRLSSSEKVSSPNSLRYQRRRAGRKGIGRFAVQRLGTALTVITQTKEDALALRLQIDWDQFLSGRDLSLITSRIEEIPKERQEGTTLIIRSLREAWLEDSIMTVYRYISDLLQPYPLSFAQEDEKDPFDEELLQHDRGFKVKLLSEQNGTTVTVADEQKVILSQALAVIQGSVDQNGNGFWSVTSKKLLNFKKTEGTIGKENKDKKEIPYRFLANINFRAYYYIWERGLIAPSLFKNLKELGQEKGGIRVYRNGFRVLPYGQKNNDWLHLDESYSKRNFLPAHGNDNFFGFVELTDIEGKFFEETSSREGLLENDAFNELVEFCYGVLTSAILRIAEARGKKKFRSQPGWIPEIDPAKATKRAADRIKKATTEVNLLLKSAAKANYADATAIAQVMKSLEQASEEIQEATTIQERQRQELLQELGMLRVLGSLGLFIGEFTHEVRQTTSAANINARILLRSLQNEEKLIAEDLLANVQSFKTYASYFDKTISDNASRDLLPQDLRHIVREFVEIVRPSAQKKGIIIDTLLEGYELLTPPMHNSELSSILFNLYTNAQKAIYRANVKGKVQLRIGSEQNRVFLSFSDNGDGIPLENHDRIFNAFFTTSFPHSLREDTPDELQGTGLGLKIVRDIVESYGGEIKLVPPPPTYSTTFKIDFPSQKN